MLVHPYNAQVQGREPKIGQQKVQFYCKGEIHWQSGCSLSMSTVNIYSGILNCLHWNFWCIVETTLVGIRLVYFSIEIWRIYYNIPLGGLTVKHNGDLFVVSTISLLFTNLLLYVCTVVHKLKYVQFLFT